MTASLRRPWVWLAIGLAVVYVRGLFLDVMDVDAAQYASMALEMLRSGHWLELQHHGIDYLDKPPLLFWTAALSYAVFGLHNWSYKLPSLLAAAAAVYSTYRFSLLFYPKATAQDAAFILASSIGLILISNDVRTDTLLLGMTACAMWQVAEYLQPSAGRAGKSLWNLLFAALFVGLAMLAKGPIGLVAPAFAVGTHLVLRRDWRRIFDWRWFLGLLVVAVLLLPMCWGLYQQFDLHPGKVVSGQVVTSGLYFYFWQQSFGRITGASTWRNNASLFYFVHVYLWAFLPWSLLFIGALCRRARGLVRQRFQLLEGDEAYSLGGFVLTFAALSLSHYKLPHYIFITLPWAAILTARWLAAPARESGAEPRLGKGWWRAQYVVFTLLAAVVVWLMVGVFPTTNILIWLVVLTLFGWLAYLCWCEPFPDRTDRLVRRSVLACIATAFVLNFHFYPSLLTYQGTSMVPQLALAANIPADKLANYNAGGDALDVYSGRIVPGLATAAAVRDTAANVGPYWLYTDSTGRARLDSTGVVYAEAFAFHHFQVSRLTMQFLNVGTRPKALVPVYLLKIAASQSH